MQVRITLQNQTRKQLDQVRRQAERKGDLRQFKRVTAILFVSAGFLYSQIAEKLGVCEDSIRRWRKKLLLRGPEGLCSRKSPGPKSNLTQTQRKELAELIDQGPQACGFAGACWRSPMIQELIYQRFGVFYAEKYISQLLKNMGFSYKKAQTVPDKQDPKKRREWFKKKWPEIYALARRKNAYVLFGDEATFYQSTSSSYTWARKEVIPTFKSKPGRKSYKVLGVIEFFSGRLVSKCHQGSLNSEVYAAFLREVMAQIPGHLILIQDGARYHTSHAMRNFFKRHSNRLTVYQLPPYSPDFNPIERLWKKMRERYTHLKYFPSLESLKNTVIQAFCGFENMPEEILSLFTSYRKRSEALFQAITVTLNINIDFRIGTEKVAA